MRVLGQKNYPPPQACLRLRKIGSHLYTVSSKITRIREYFCVKIKKFKIIVFKIRLALGSTY